MNIYISCRYSRREEARDLALLLEDHGHTITGEWVFRDQPNDYEDVTHEEVAQYALEDIMGVRTADVIVALSERSDNHWGRGGRHVEFGIALEKGIKLITIGPFENIFHYLSEVTNYPSTDAFLEDFLG